MLEVHRLNVFMRVADARSVSVAAEIMHLSQPSVSQHVAHLEAALKVPLFDRCNRRLILTQAGEILYSYGKKIVALVAETRQAAAHLKGRHEGEILLAACPLAGEYVLPAVVARFRERFPGVRARITITQGEGVLEALAQGHVGVVGRLNPRPFLQFRHVAAEELVLVTPASHRWNGAVIADANRLPEEPFIMRERHSCARRLVDERLQDLGLRQPPVTVVIEVGSSEALKQAVMAGMGVAIMAYRAAASELASGSLGMARLSGPIRHDLYSVVDTRQPQSLLNIRFLEFLHCSCPASPQRALTAGPA